MKKFLLTFILATWALVILLPSNAYAQPQISKEHREVEWLYAFFEENGNRIEYPIKSVYAMSYDGNSIEDDKPPSKNTEPFHLAQSQERKETVVASETFQKLLTDEPIQVVVPLTRQKGLQSLLEEVSQIRSPVEKSFVVQMKVSYQGRPSGVYEVYVNLPNEKAITDRDTYLVGTIAFFVLPSKERVRKTFRFDITDELMRQARSQVKQANNGGLTLTIFKEMAPADEQITIENVTLYKYELSHS